MPDLIEQEVSCPYCGESISVLIDDSLPEQNYIEDCQVCCRPIVFDVAVDHEGDVLLTVRAENEA
ncbi:MAG: CPXCG motif-containing cysteine-rich protein [Woeseiaceae bacterium]|nr:CPXCG motif-containing cysteine-rich protein [Woeseiaceae bacterium]